MRVVLLGVAYGALLGVVFAALTGVAIAAAAPQLGLALPHRLAGLSPLQIILNTVVVGLWAGALGGALLGVLIRLFAPGKVSVGRWIGALAASLPLVWLPFFGLRGFVRNEMIGTPDVVQLVLTVVAPVAAAIMAGALIGGRLARAARPFQQT